MKSNKGFTLVELLAVIAILAILVLIALPNTIEMFKEAKKNSFLTECKQIFKTAQNQWMSDSLFDTNEQIYSRCASCSGKSLKLSGRTQIDYYVKVNKAGKIMEFYVTDGTYQFKYDENELLITDITDAETIAELSDNEILKISASGAVSEPSSFATDSWRTIVNAVRNNNTSNYNVGDTKEVDLGTYGTHIIRIANKTTPSECLNDDFSQTACGFVLEFADIITKHVFNTGTFTGYPNSSIREFLNNDIYNSFPSDLKGIVVNTKTLSGHLNSNDDYVESSDKVFLVSGIELWGSIPSNNREDYTRQLDYYANKNVTAADFTNIVKNYNGSSDSWWTRYTHLNGSTYAAYSQAYTNVRYSTAGYQLTASLGIAPAFKIN